jgi:hypothetical protein
MKYTMLETFLISAVKYTTYDGPIIKCDHCIDGVATYFLFRKYHFFQIKALCERHQRAWIQTNGQFDFRYMTPDEYRVLSVMMT